MQKIVISEWVPEECIAPYRKDFDFDVPSQEKHAYSYEELLTRAPEADGILILDNTGDKKLMDAAVKLKVIANFGVGYDNIDWKYATQIGLPVINTPTQVTEATAEHAAALIASVMRSIAKYDRDVRAGIWESPNFADVNTQIEGSTLAILGFGRIGKRVCRKMQGFGMNVIYYDKFRASEDIEKEFGVKYVSFDDALKEADCISLHMPYLPENHHLFGKETFAKMKKTAYFVNCARGKIVDEQALADALKSGEIKGAGLDVFEDEPNVNPDLLKLSNVTLTPHIASLTMKARVGMCNEALSGITGVLRGEKPYKVVNKEVLK
jgi:glyoxylate reductase